MLLKNTNRKPYPIYRMIPLSMTLSDLWPRFQGHNIFRHWISQKRHEIELLWNVNSYALCRMVTFSMILMDPNSVVKVMAFLKSYISKTVCLRTNLLYSTLIGNHTEHMEWYHVWWPWLTSKRVVRVCQHQLSFLFTFIIHWSNFIWFLPRDAMRKRGLRCHPLTRCPSVCPSVCHVGALYPHGLRYRPTSYSAQ